MREQGIDHGKPARQVISVKICAMDDGHGGSRFQRNKNPSGINPASLL
jgi:hypothetical protein